MSFTTAAAEVLVEEVVASSLLRLLVCLEDFAAKEEAA
jgi:hypothetical protein